MRVGRVHLPYTTLYGSREGYVGTALCGFRFFQNVKKLTPILNRERVRLLWARGGGPPGPRHFTPEPGRATWGE